MHVIVRDIAPAVASALGEGWTATQFEHNENAATLSGPAGAEVFIWTNAYPHCHQRAEIVGQYPEHKPYDVKRHKITVSLDKTAEQIARDITRRLLPDYLPDLARALEAQASHEAYVRRVADNAATLTASPVVEGGPTHRSTETRQDYRLTVPAGWGTLQVMGDTATIELHSLPVDVAARVLAALEG